MPGIVLGVVTVVTRETLSLPTQTLCSCREDRSSSICAKKHRELWKLVTRRPNIVLMTKESFQEKMKLKLRLKNVSFDD